MWSRLKQWWNGFLAYNRALFPGGFAEWQVSGNGRTPPQILLVKPSSEFEDVRTFHQHFSLLNLVTPGHLTQRKLGERIAFLQEELNEFKEAAQTQDLVGQADALIDLVYIAKGTACMLGLPWEQLWKVVHGANMAKERRASPTGDHHDVIKPPGWVAPEPLMERILQSHGYHKEIWCEGSNEVVYDLLCIDDPHQMRDSYATFCRMRKDAHGSKTHQEASEDHV